MRTDYSGKTVKIKNGFVDPYNGKIPAGSEYRVEGYWDEITGKSWGYSDGVPAAMNYGMRAGLSGLPWDDEVLYGKIGAFGFLVHVSEVEFVITDVV
jgi:hypothetical protein